MATFRLPTTARENPFVTLTGSAPGTPGFEGEQIFQSRFPLPTTRTDKSQFEGVDRTIQKAFNNLRASGRRADAFALRDAVERFQRSGKSLGVNAFARAAALTDLKNRMSAATSARQAGLTKAEADQLTRLASLRSGEEERAFRQSLDRARLVERLRGRGGRSSIARSSSRHSGRSSRAQSPLTAGTGRESALRRHDKLIGGMTKPIFGKEVVAAPRQTSGSMSSIQGPVDFTAGRTRSVLRGNVPVTQPFGRTGGGQTIRNPFVRPAARTSGPVSTVPRRPTLPPAGATSRSTVPQASPTPFGAPRGGARLSQVPGRQLRSAFGRSPVAPQEFNFVSPRSVGAFRVDPNTGQRTLIGRGRGVR